MLIYEKIVDNVKKLYCNLTGHIPTNDDVALTYKDADGDTITCTRDDTYLNGDCSNNIQRMWRKSDGKVVNVFANTTEIIGGEIEEKTITGMEIEAADNIEFTNGDIIEFTSEQLKVYAIYSDGDKVATDDYTTSPVTAENETEEAITQTITVSLTDTEFTKTFTVTVNPTSTEQTENNEEQ